MNLIMFALILMCEVIVGAEYYYTPIKPPDLCAKGEERGICLPLPACKGLVAQLQDPHKANEALRLAHRRKCGFEGLDLKVCCLKNETVVVDTESRVGETNSKSPNNEASENQLGSKVEIFHEPPTCGKGILAIYDDKCFRNNGQTRSRRKASPPGTMVIPGGKPLGLGLAPWMAVLGYTPSASFWECGGSIITSRHILTAAHCINQRLALVRVGELDLASEDDGATPADYLIKRKIPHEEYQTRTHANDIGLLLLKETIKFTDFIKPICLPNLRTPTEWPDVGDMAIVAGWGRIAYYGEQSTQVLYAHLDVFDTNFCKHQYRNYSNAVIDDKTLCVGDITGVKDSCKGDSGGPLIVKTCDSQFSWHYTQVGVVSYGLECARAGYPGVYMRVAHYMPWIRNNIKPL